jgi:hypothetical protein
MKIFLVLCLCISHIAYGFDITWHAPINLSNPATEIDNPQAGLDAQGNAVAVWTSFSMGLLINEGSTKLFGQPWIPAFGQNINDTTAGMSGQAALSVDSQGNAIAIWEYDNPVSLRYSYKPFGMAWTPATLTNFQTFDYQVVLNPPENGTAVWDQGGALFASTFNSNVWTTPVQLDTQNRSPVLAVDPNGNAIAMWSVNQEVKSASLPFGGSWETPVIIETYMGAGSTGFKSIAVDESGNAVGVWSTDTGVHSATKLFNQSWSTVYSFPNSGTNANGQPSVAIDPQGNAVAIWPNINMGTIQTAYKPFGEPWSDVVTIGLGDSPQVAVDSCGTAVTAWAGNNNIIQTAFKPVGMSWMISQSFPSANFGGPPQVSIKPCGHIMVIYPGPNGNPSNTYAVEGFINTPAFSSLTGKQKQNNFGSFKEYANVLEWQPSTTPVKGYNIFRNLSLIASVDGDDHSYTDHDQAKGQPITYQVTAIDLNGVESLPLQVTVQ